MKSSRFVATMAALSVGALCVATARPQDPPANAPAKPAPKRGETLGKITGPTLEKYDLNRNGFLEPSEREAMRKDREARVKTITPRLFAKYDANKNGVLDPEETAAVQRDRERLRTASRGKALQRYDANRNGVLDPEEKEAMRALQSRGKRGAPGTGPLPRSPSAPAPQDPS